MKEKERKEKSIMSGTRLSVCCTTCSEPLDVTIITEEPLYQPVAQSYRSEPPDGASHWAVVGSESPPRRSRTLDLQDLSPHQMILACLYDSAGNSSADQLQRGQR